MANKSDAASERESPVIFLMGPTASGKTRLAELLAQVLPCDVISVDSSAVYRGMDIGSAKPDAELLARLPHRLVDIRNPDEPYSAADFVNDALAEIKDIHERGRIPLLVGGTMLYYKALREGLAEMPAADPQLRAQISAQAEAEGWQAIHAELAQVDPLAAARIHPNDPQRLQRALEVYRLSGRALSDWHANEAASPLSHCRLHQLAIAPADRTLLHQRIEQRFDQMLAEGLVAEVRQLLKYPEYRDTPAMKAVGYRQVQQYLDGELDETAMRERGIIASRQLAKRQLTWLRGWHEVEWLFTATNDYIGDFSSKNNDKACSILNQALQICRK